MSSAEHKAPCSYRLLANVREIPAPAVAADDVGAFLAGAVVTEAFRELSRQIAAGANMANDRAAETAGKGLKMRPPR